MVISPTPGKDGALNLGLSLRPTPIGSVDGVEARKKKGNGMGGIIAAIALKIGLLKALAFKALVPKTFSRVRFRIKNHYVGFAMHLSWMIIS